LCFSLFPFTEPSSPPLTLSLPFEDVEAADELQAEVPVLTRENGSSAMARSRLRPEPMREEAGKVREVGEVVQEDGAVEEGVDESEHYVHTAGCSRCQHSVLLWEDGTRKEKEERRTI
jgi:hypothetical protein